MTQASSPSIEAQLLWNDGQLKGIDRLIIPDSALAADGRWQAARQAIARDGAALLDASPWIEPANLAPAQMPFADFRLRSLAIPGRFYPRLAFPSISQGPRDLRPTRLLAREGGQLTLDPNHPLADLDVRLSLRPSTLEPAPGVRLVELFNGPGMQRLVAAPEATYLGLDSVAREDEASDDQFYAQPRLTHHLDAHCRTALTALYARLLRPRSLVLDLMSSWTSHLPEEVGDLHLAGLGMNGLELHANKRLSERVVKDLNARPELPWADAAFDAVFCTASVEYLTQPLAVLDEVRRVLNPGGVFVVSFSDRWFPTKAIKVWGDLHPFERLGMVASLMRATGFVHLECETLRGLRRPDDDKYAAQRGFSDPLFAVWGRTPTA